MKYWYQSKTIWFNVLTLVLAVLALPEFISLISASLEPWIILVNAIGNMILRMYTTKAIEPIE